MNREKRISTISVEHSTVPGERAIQHPRRVSGTDLDGPGHLNPSRPQRFRNGKLVAVGGIPVKGEIPSGDSEVYAVQSAADALYNYLNEGNPQVEAWQHHAVEMFMQGNDEAFNCF